MTNDMPYNPRIPDEHFATPQVARITDYLKGGRDNYEVDRKLARSLEADAPQLRAMTQINTRHRAHAVTALAHDLKIRQFLDLGCGNPTYTGHHDGLHQPPFVDEVARSAQPSAHVIHVDNDPIACAHVRALAEHPRTAAVRGDIRKMDDLLDELAAHELIDLTQPTAALLYDSLPYVTDTEAAQALATLRARLPPGSAISVTHATADMAPQSMAALTRHYAKAGITYRPRTLDHLRELLGDWPALPPGIVPTSQWQQPTDNPQLSEDDLSHAYAVIVTPDLSLHPHHQTTRTSGEGAA